MKRVQRLFSIGVVVIGVTLSLWNIFMFVFQFPRSSAADSHGSVSLRLPLQQNALWHPPPPPAFLGNMSARSAYVAEVPPRRSPLLRYNVDEDVPLASLTKLMSALVILEQAPDWERMVTIVAADRRGGVRERLFPGQTVSLGDLWQLALVGSDNDALAALIRGLGMSEIDFVAAMNSKAAALGLRRTTSSEPTGLAPTNISTAREVAVLARAALANALIDSTLAQPEARVAIAGKPHIVLSSDQQLKSRQPGWREGWRFVSGKTGYLPEAGYNVALLARTDKGGTILAVVLGSQSIETRTNETKMLLRWAAEVAALAREPSPGEIVPS